ncbi:hypothetical protein N7535_009362 [Penicillium sp. DV-2018c]|nr:hypothetical protein N7535_009362 [Penicillium sp. DV-2018c]
METVNKYVNAASNAVWGENSPEAQKSATNYNEEPISGVQGTGRPTDPYDGGNQQPGHIPTEGNTAPQDPFLGKHSTPQGGTATTHADPSTSKAPENVDVPFSTPKGAGTGLSAGTDDYEHRGSAAKPVSGGSTATGSVADQTGSGSSGTEQRSTGAGAGAGVSQSGEGAAQGSGSRSDEAQSGEEQGREALGGGEDGKKGEDQEIPRFGASQEASKEALEGPQGPAPKSAADFENEAKRKSVATGAAGAKGMLF